MGPASAVPAVDLPATDADYVMWLSPAGDITAISETVRSLLGEEYLRMPVAELSRAVFDDVQQAAVVSVWERVLTTGAARMTLQLGPAMWIDVSAKHMVDTQGQPILVVARDVTDDVMAQTLLAASERRWRVAFEHSPIGGALTDETGRILVANETLGRMLGTRDHQLTDREVTELFVTDSGGTWGDFWSKVLSQSGENVVADRMLRTSDGSQLWGRVTAAALGTDRVVLQVEDITSRREAELELANRALHDGLTGAPNRFLTRQWLASALEDHPGGRVGILYCDVDRFKIVNDSLGHAAGDELLLHVADRLRGPLRPEDLLGRVGGDEFVIVIEDVDSDADLARVAQRLLESLDEPFELGGHRHAVSISLGGAIGTYPDTADEVLIRADMALLRAKRLGRARYVPFDPGVDRVATRADLQLEDDLRVSLDADELRAHYQPIVDLADLSVVGHEALVRWEHPSHGLLSPARFLDLAESSGLIRPLGWWMLSRACTDLTSPGGLPPGTWVAVNASPSQLTRTGVAADVTRALDASGLPPGKLHLEVTETALITASATLASELRQLSDLGVKIALDDFGTGYSSLALLRSFPVDVVKIDMSFVTPLLTDRSARAIVKAVLGLSQDLGMTTVAEGIETVDQLEILRDMGCSHGQGFLFGRPEPVAVRAGIMRLSA